MSWSARSAKRSRFSKRREEAVDDGAYQVDLVVAFFSILLILFVVYSAQVYSEVTEKSKIYYQTRDIPSKPFQLRSFAALYPYRDYWLVKNGQVAKLDLSAIARQYLAGKGGLNFEDSISGVDMYLTPAKKEVTAYDLRLLIYSKTIPEWLIDKKFEVRSVKKESRENIATFLFKQKRAAFFFIWHNEWKRMAPVLESLRQQGFPYGYVILEKGNDQVSISIHGNDYGMRNILRSY